LSGHFIAGIAIESERQFFFFFESTVVLGQLRRNRDQIGSRFLDGIVCLRQSFQL
jgi:hypothetical protein